MYISIFLLVDHFTKTWTPQHSNKTKQQQAAAMPKT
jgi:hypothetical protein